MGIKLVRIDDRLIHGQVATTWIKDFNIEQVLIVNDKVAGDNIQKSVAGLAAPAGVRVLVFGVEQFINILKKNPIKRDTMLLFTTSTDVLKVIRNGLEVKEINAGGMRFNSKRERLTKAISVTEEEKNAFKEMINMGIKVNVQMVPKDESIDFRNII